MKILGLVLMIAVTMIVTAGIAEAMKKQPQTYGCVCFCSIDHKTSPLQRAQRKNATTAIGTDCESLDGGGCRYETGKGIYSTGTLGSCQTAS